jgi:hypothetical protein
MRTDINSKFAEMQREAEVALHPAAVSNASPRTDLTVRCSGLNYFQHSPRREPKAPPNTRHAAHVGIYFS